MVQISHAMALSFGKKRMKKDEIITLYNDRLDNFGNIPSSAGWKDLETQYLRFAGLTDSLEIRSVSRILDLGCGYGALIDYFKTINVKIKQEKYCGIDFSKKMIDAAKIRYPKAKFIYSDFFKTDIENYDFILCSGALNIKINNINMYSNLEKFLTTFLPRADKALSFNLIHDIVDYRDNNLNYYNLEKVVKILTCYSRFFHIKNSNKLYETSVTIFKS